MGSIKDEVNKEVIKKAVSRNTVENVRAPEKQRDESGSSTNPTPNKIGAECPKSCCSGLLMQSISVATYKPWIYNCTSCTSTFEYH